MNEEENTGFKLNLRSSNTSSGGAEPELSQVYERPAARTPPVRPVSAQKSVRPSTLPSAGGVLRQRGKKPRTTDIEDVWDAQPEKFDFTPPDSRLMDDIGQKVSKVSKGAKDLKRRVAHSQSSSRGMPRFQVPDFTALSKLSRRSTVAIAVGLIVAGGALLTLRSGSPEVAGSTEETLGSSTDGSPSPADTLPVVGSETEFPLLFPSSKSESDYRIVKVSPPENDPVYAYVDTFAGGELRISQQEVPDEFKGNEAAKLQETAANFQATSVIQVDDTIVYHGFAEKYGGVQSLIFIKNDVMVFISAAKKFSDDAWAGYVLNLN